MNKLVQWGTLGIAAILFAGLAPAATVYVTGFESTEVPPFTLGNLNSQNGWVATLTDVQVSTSFPQTGSQGIFATGVNDSFSRLFSVGGSPTISVAAGLDYVSGPETFTFGLSGTGGVVASVRLNQNGSLTFSNGVSTAANLFSTGNYNNYLITANYSTNTYDFSLNSGFYSLTNIPFAAAGGGTFSGVSVIGSGGFGVLGFDSLTINSAAGGSATPEPATWMMFAGGLALLASGASRRKNALLETSAL